MRNTRSRIKSIIHERGSQRVAGWIGVHFYSNSWLSDYFMQLNFNLKVECHHNSFIRGEYNKIDEDGDTT